MLVFYLLTKMVSPQMLYIITLKIILKAEKVLMKLSILSLYTSVIYKYVEENTRNILIYKIETFETSVKDLWGLEKKILLSIDLILF